MRERVIFDNIEDVKTYLRSNPEQVMKKKPWRVAINGQVKYVFSGNSDQAVAAVARETTDVKVESVSMVEMFVVT